MKYESCNISDFEVEQLADEGQKPYRLCKSCLDRLLNKALRPLEFFNLTAIHGHSFYLHDDFYDYETGEATQPDIEVLHPDKFPFPDFDQIKNNLDRLIDFAFVQYFTNDNVIKQLNQFDKNEMLKTIDKKVKYNRAINYKAYEIVGKVIGNAAKDWIKAEWANKQENELLIFAEAISKCLDFDEAFEILTNEIESKEDKYLSENISALLYFQSDKTLDWIEKVIRRTNNISTNWGTLAATSQFSWVTADKWLNIGRPISLVAIDALLFCTTPGDRQNQAFWLQQNPPKLTDNPRPEIIANKLKDYLAKDNVPRTKSAINKIIDNVFQVTEWKPEHTTFGLAIWRGDKYILSFWFAIRLQFQPTNKAEQ